ncbi:MAG: DUF4955 domain-containing protein [Planctomycetota bacterium]
MEVESVIGQTVRFTQPLLASYEFTSPTYKGGPKIVQIFADGDRLMESSGVEDLAFVGNYRDCFKHFFNRAADGYNFLLFENVRRSWVRRVRSNSGTRSVVFAANGRENLVYDVCFEGNSGHYTITTTGNHVGNQASFLREVSPNHHGFGATDSAFGTVYHRCNQFGGPEGHGGYPQSTLYDVQEGNLGLSRIGGAAPHQGTGTVFWNWRQGLFVPSASGISGNDGRYLQTALGNAEISFWPDRIMRPSVIGLHGEEATIDDVVMDELAILRTQGQRVFPESLFEEQLRLRLGRVPRWLMRRSLTFEAVTRYSQVDIAAPAPEARFGAGESLTVVPRLHPEFSLSHLSRLELLAARGHENDRPETVVASTSDAAALDLAWSPPAAGAWRIRLRLTNSLGEETLSEPRYVFSFPADESVAFLPATAGWLQPRSLDPRAIYSASANVTFTDLDTYRAEVRALEAPLVEPAVTDPAQVAVGNALVDGNLNTNATSAAALRFFGIKGLVIDLGSTERVDFIQLVGAQGSGGADFFAAMDLQVATEEDAQLSYTNSDFTWTTVRRLGHATAAARIALNNGRRTRIHLPLGTEARYLRLVVRTLDSAAPSAGDLTEIRAGRYVGL